MASLKFQIKEPKIKLEKNPLILLLHGYGSNDDDLFSFASELPDNYYIISAQAPHSLQYGAYAWYAINFDADENKFSDLPQARDSRDLIATFIDELLELYPIDEANVALLGFSQGTILSYAVALSYPEKIAKVIALSGYLNLEILKDDYLKNNFSNLKMFVSHGTQDQVIPVDWARKAPEKLLQLGIENVYKEYSMGHGINLQNFNDLKNWLIS
jgi:phospholipase/carboxylesterase